VDTKQQTVMEQSDLLQFTLDGIRAEPYTCTSKFAPLKDPKRLSNGLRSFTLMIPLLMKSKRKLRTLAIEENKISGLREDIVTNLQCTYGFPEYDILEVENPANTTNTTGARRNKKPITDAG